MCAVIRVPINAGSIPVVLGMPFANILEHVLIEEFELLRDSLAIGAKLIVSGILVEQKENIISRFSSHFDLEKEKTEGDWAALSFKKK